MKITPEYIRKLARDNGIDISKYDMDQLIMGYNVEKEHDTNDEIDVVKSKIDPLKIAIAHLREKKNYYTLLKKVEEAVVKKLTEDKQQLENKLFDIIMNISIDMEREPYTDPPRHYPVISDEEAKKIVKEIMELFKI